MTTQGNYPNDKEIERATECAKSLNYEKLLKQADKCSKKYGWISFTPSKEAFDKFIKDYVQRWEMFREFSADKKKYIEKENSKVDDKNKEIDKTNTSITTTKAELQQQYQGIVREYGKLLHESDFENLDYILYLLVTNRADTMKEALQLLDDERRNNRLIQSVTMSAQYITQNFAGIVRNLGNQISNTITNTTAQSTKEIVNAINDLDLTTYVTTKVKVDVTVH